MLKKINENLEMISFLIIISILTIVCIGSILVVYKLLTLKQYSYFLILFLPLEIITYILQKKKNLSFQKEEFLIFFLIICSTLSLIFSKNREESLFVGDGVNSINGTKRNPSLSADLFGDYREEVIFPTKDNKRLRVFTTTIYSPYRVENLMQSIQYHLQTTLQNIGYIQPPHLDYFLYQQ